MKIFNTGKPALPWTHRLFKGTGETITVSQHKTYFAHRYHDCQVEMERGSFSQRRNNIQQLFEQTNGDYLTPDREPCKLENLSSNQSDNLKFPSSLASSTPFTVLNCYDETPDTKTFRLGRINDPVFTFLPGQYIALSIVIQGQEYKRFYSLSSSPSRPKNIEITVKRVSNGGIVSNWLNDSLKVGDTVNIKGPFGKFSCINNAPQKILFLAAGSGIVPIMSMLRWLTDTNAPVNIRLLLSFRTSDDIIFREELKLMAARHKNVDINITLTTDAIERYQWSGLTGHVNEKMLAERIPDLTERSVYLCGPEAFMAECRKQLLALNLPPEKIFSESFTVTKPPAKSLPSCAGQLATDNAANYRVSFAKSGKIVPADGRRTLLELAEQSGIAIGHECLSGSCGECMVKCLNGKVDMTDQAEIDVIDRNKGWVYSCCSYPASNLVLDA